MIEIDDRQGSAELLQFFSPTEARLNRLEFGDFSFLGRGPDMIPILIGIERKSIVDLADSAWKGRFAGHQLPGMQKSYGVVYLIVEGIWKNDPASGDLLIMQGREWISVSSIIKKPVTTEAVMNFLNTLDICEGVHIRFTSTQQGTADVVKFLYNWWNKKEFEEHHSSDVTYFGTSLRLTERKPSLLRRFASLLPGVGWRKSKNICNYFTSVHHLVTADESEWNNVQGIGKVTINAIKKALHGHDHKPRTKSKNIRPSHSRHKVNGDITSNQVLSRIKRKVS